VCYLDITIANLGDTRAVLLKKAPVRLSVDHKPDSPEEKKRIEALGFEVKNNRLMGTLAISRAFGDFNLKAKGLSSEPFIKSIQADQGDYIVIATDGIWDQITD